MAITSIRDFLYPMQNGDKSAKTPLKIISHIGDKVKILHESDDAAGEFRMRGILQGEKVLKWYIKDGGLVIDIGPCPRRGIEYTDGQSIAFCFLCPSRKVYDGKVVFVHRDCCPENCPLADRT